jgi:phytol kinase
MIHNNWVALIITFALSLIWLRLNDWIAHKGWVSSPVSRKIIHIGTGPIFVLCWLLFDDQPLARYLAALVPLAITAQFALVGTGVMKDPSAVKAMSRTGDRKEILRGPLYYGIVFVLLTIVFWRNTPTGIVALMCLCGGDGLADIIGKRYGARSRLAWSKKKSWIGSLGMLVGGWFFSTVIVGIYTVAGYFSGSLGHYLIGITIISLAATIIESLPLADVDNITVPLVAVLLGLLLF